MSYNGYSKLNHTYSPYYQQAPGQDGRTPYADHARGNKGYQSNSYQPLSAYQNSHTQQSAPAQSSNAGMAYNDTGYGGGPSSGGQDSRAAYSNSRSSVDTTALGNLAYASSLGRDNTDLQQNMSYNRPQNPASYSMPNSYGINHSNTLQYGADHQRRDSTASPATAREDLRVRPSISSPSLGYHPDSGNTGYQSPQIQAGPAQAQYTGTHYGQSHGEPYQTSQYSNPSRPPSGQAVHHPTTITSSQAASPVVAPDQNLRLHSDGNYRRVSTGGRPEKPRVSTPQQQSYGGTSTGPQVGNFTKNAQPKQAASSSAPVTAARIATPTSANNTGSQPSNGFRKSTDHQSNDHVSQRSTPTNTHFPTTVNPSQVFNDAEYQRRQAAAAAEAEVTRKKAEDARATALPKDTLPSIPPSADSDVDAAKKEQMELEMKQMIEKMRDYKSKDPSFFSQIWEQVKKGQPAQRTSQVMAHESSPSPVVMNDQPPNPFVQLPPESELPAADGEAFPPNSDRGRFPAQRRRRGGSSFTPEKKQGTPKGSAKSPPAKSNVAGNQAMHKAMGNSHRKSDSSMPPAQTTNQSVALQPEETQSQATPTAKITSTSGQSAIPTPSATSKAQAKPPTPKAYGTYWPEHKKKQLADAARVALTTTPQNTGKEITPDEIHKLLDQNPSYIQLCEILENRGFVIDRGQFARLLLSAVPDLAQTSTPRSPAASSSHHGLPTPSTAPPGGGPGTGVKPSPPQLTTSQLPYSIPPNQQTNRYVTPYGIPNQPGNHPAPQAQMTPASGSSRDYRHMDPSNPMSIDNRRQYPVAQPPPNIYNGHGVLYPTGPILPSPPYAPISTKKIVRWGEEQNRSATSVQPALSTKQDLARKRSFGEIVDLTQAMSEDEDNEPPNQRSRVDDTTLKVYTAGRSVDSGIATPSSVKDTTNLEEFRHKPTGKEAYLRAPNIISPMNKRQDALRRSSYNPKTISRDVLLAVGKHPSMAPLNSHLDVLRDRFTAVNNDSDLSTFRWDLVDPGGPPPVQHTTVDEDSHQSRRSSGKHVRPRIAVVVGGSGLTEVEPGQGRRRNTAFKPTRGGRFTSGSRPKSVPDPVHPETPQKDVVSSQGGITRTSLSDSGFSRFVHNDLPVMLNNITGASVRTPVAQLSQAHTPASGSTGKVRVPGRRGRPPGAKNRNTRPDKGTPKKTKAALTQPEEQPPNDTAMNDAQNDSAFLDNVIPMQTHAAPVRTPSSSLQDRPRISTTPAGPSGLGQATSPSVGGIAVVIPSRSSSVMEGSPVKSVGLSAKKALPNPVPKTSMKQSPAPSYRVYQCRWDRCPAELHNIDTLRKHVRKHRHVRDFDVAFIPCLWGTCGDSGRDPATFDSAAALDEHVARHINAVARASALP